MFEGASAEALDEQDDDEGEGGQRQVLHGAEVVGGGVAALRPGDRHRHEGDADEGDDHAGDERREEAQQSAEEGADRQAEGSGDEHRPVDRGELVSGRTGLGDGEHRRDPGGGGGVDEGEPVAGEAAETDGLQDGGESGDQEARRDEPGHSGGVQADGLADDQRRGDDARVHGGDVLECGGDEPGGRKLLVDRVNHRAGEGFRGGAWAFGRPRCGLCHGGSLRDDRPPPDYGRAGAGSMPRQRLVMSTGIFGSTPSRSTVASIRP